MKLPTTEQVLALLRTGTPDERVAFVKQLPPNDLLPVGNRLGEFRATRVWSSSGSGPQR